MRLALTTLGCPDWDLETVCEAASRFGYDGVDFRGLLDEIDVTRRPEFTTDLDLTRARIGRAGLSVSALSSSIAICERTDRERNVQEADRLIPLARELDVEYVRVFGKGDAENHSVDGMADVGRETMDAIRSLDGAEEIRWLVETHDHWTRATDCRSLLDAIDAPNVGICWDVGHTARVGDERPAETYEVLGPDVEYVHLKDAVREPDHEHAMDDGWRYVSPGTGDLPLAESVQLLDSHGYDGWVLFEHEKRWHPELAEPELAYPAFVEWFRSVT